MDGEPAVCVRCGRTEKEPLPTWTRQAEGERHSWLCETCTREHLRSIEGKLDDQWW